MDLNKYIEGKELFDGHYRLIKLLSEEGGTADVWLAENYESVDTAFSEENDDIIRLEGTGVLVAIKIYRPKNALDVEGEQSFRQEFKTIFNCHHANLIPTTDYSICDGMPYLVMPFCKNGSAEKLAGKLTASGDIWKFIFDTASGLEYLHSCSPQIIHQDIKPGNILIDANGNYCITDFGISVKSGIKDDQYLDNESCGTTIYMPPERFDDEYNADSASDVWALGATIYELINGDVPFGSEGGKAQKEHKVVPPLNHNVPKAIRTLIYSCLNANPKKRPSAHQIAELARNKGKKPIKNLLSVLVFVVLCSMGILFWALSKPSVEPIEPFLLNYYSGDSIILVQKQEAMTENYLNHKRTTDRLIEAQKKYGIALKCETKNVIKLDSASIKIEQIDGLFPLLEVYKGIIDTLNMVIEDDAPIQVEKYQEKRNKISEELKQKILNL